MPHFRENYLIRLAVVLCCAGVLLLAHSITGLFLPLDSDFNRILLLSHFVFHVWAVLLAFQYFGRLVSGGRFGTLIPSAVLILWLGMLAILQAAPVTSRDALIHHLAVPKWWVAANSIFEIEWHSWSYYPMLIQQAYVEILRVLNPEMCALYHGSYLLLLASAVAAFLYSQTKVREIAVGGWFLVLGVPVLLRLATEPLVDLPLALYCSLATFLLVEWSNGRGGIGKICLIGVLLGLACGVKYNGALIAFFVLLCFPLMSARSPRSVGSHLVAIIIAGIFCTALFFPWLARNLMWTGNPVYPLYSGLFGTSGPASGVEGFGALEYRYLRYGEEWWGFLLLPFRMMVMGRDGSPEFFDGMLHPFLLFVLLAPFRKKIPSWVLYAGAVCLSYSYSALFLSGARVRYLTPIVGLAGALALAGLKRFTEFLPGKARFPVFSFAIVGSILFSTLYLWRLVEQEDAVNYALGREQKQDYLAKHVADYTAIQYVNAHVSREETVYLLLTGNRFFYYEPRVYSGGHFSWSYLVHWLKSANSAEDFKKQLEYRDIGYILLNTEQTKEKLQVLLTPEEAKLWNAFQATSLIPQAQIGPYSFWKVGLRTATPTTEP